MVAFKGLQRATLIIVALSLSFIINAAQHASHRRLAGAIPGAYIVEFEDDSSADPEQFFSLCATHKIETSPRLSLSYKLFNGVSFNILSGDNDATLAWIKGLTMVKNLWPIGTRKIPTPIGNRPGGSPADGVPGQAGLEERSFSARSTNNYTIDNYVPHIMGNVDKLHKEGYTGKGVTVAIIDTGFDLLHPCLGGGFGPGFKVSFGYDLVGDNYTADNMDNQPDPVPNDLNGHGTHVAGILAADYCEPHPTGLTGDPPPPFSGVAPDVTLGMFRIFGEGEYTDYDTIIAGLNRAYDSGADVISGSFGGGNGWVEDAVDILVTRIIANGTACSISAGNDGVYGLFNTSSPAEGAFAIGAAWNELLPEFLIDATYKTSNDSEVVPFTYSIGRKGNFGTASFPLYALTLNTQVTNDGCEPLPPSTPDLSSYVVLIRTSNGKYRTSSGICTFNDQLENAAAFGAKQIMFYWNETGDFYIGPSFTRIPGNLNLSTTVATGMVSSTLGATWISDLAAGINVTLSFTAEYLANITYREPKNPYAGGLMGYYSSWGPTYETFLKPQVSAPGGDILSTFLVANRSYIVISGTSMAAPYAAGCMALVKQVRGKDTSPIEIQNLLSSTAKVLPWNDRYYTHPGVVAPPIQQGGGLIDCYAAAHIQTTLNVSRLEFNDTQYFVERNPFVIRNNGTESVTYSFGNLGAPTVLTLDEDDIIVTNLPLTLLFDKLPTAQFTPETVTLSPGSEAEIIVQVTPPTGLDVGRLPVYSGFVTINGTNGDYLTIPYAGVAARMYDVKITNIKEGYPKFINSLTNATIDNQTAIQYFTLPKVNTTGLNDTVTPANDTAYPELIWNIAFGTRIVRVDVLPEGNTTESANATDILGYKSLGPLPGYPFELVTRNYTVNEIFTGQLDDLSFVPEGEYSLLFRVLKIFGNQTDGGDWETFGTAPFGITYQ